MKNVLYPLLILFLACGCNPESNSDSTTESPAALKQTKESKRDDPKWMISIEGMPERSGRVITAATMEGYGKYALGASGFTASIGLERDDPQSFMMIKFSDENIRCVSEEGATAIRDGDKAIISGEVLCYPADGSFDDAKPAAIDGYFEVRK
jgi:hypothetical protein